MPPGSRIRTDNVFGTLTDNPLTAGATTMNSGGLANLAAVSSAHALIVIDPLRSAGAPECVIVTAHTGAATSATITRGAYGTTAREHASGVLWVHAPSVEDFIRIVTSSTRPSDPYEGQLIYETDTDYYMGYSGSAWEYGTKVGAFTTWSPTLEAVSVNPTFGTGNVRTGRWVRTGRHVSGWGIITYGSSGNTFGTGAYLIAMPVTPVAAASGAPVIVGHGIIFDSGTINLAHNLIIDQAVHATKAIIIAENNAGAASPTNPITFANNDSIRFWFSYEAAS